MRRDEYINEINEIFKNEYKLKEFLKIAAYTQKYNLYNQIEIYNQANDIKAVASKSFWEDNLKMNIKDDELDNFILITGNNKEQIKLYDINQMKKEGNLDINDMVWTFNNNGESDYKVLYLNRSYHAEIRMPSGNVVTGQSYIKREYTNGSVLISINGVEYRTSWANVVIFKNCN